MKAKVTHDALGAIEHLVVLPSDAPPASIAVAAGQLTTEVEIPDLRLDANGTEDLENLRKTIRGYRVEAKSGRLIRNE